MIPKATQGSAPYSEEARKGGPHTQLVSYFVESHACRVGHASKFHGCRLYGITSPVTTGNDPELSPSTPESVAITGDVKTRPGFTTRQDRRTRRIGGPIPPTLSLSVLTSE